MDLVQIDGSLGEGGGQVLRTALGLSMTTGRPFVIRGIRARRRRPGLLRQHLTAVQAAQELCGARVSGAEIRSHELQFEPSELRAGEYYFSIGTAGSTTLVLHALLPALLAVGDSRVILEGGTHNPWAPPFEHIQLALSPVLRRMGATLELTLDRHGFHPAGGGRVVATFGKARALQPIELLERGSTARRWARAKVSRLDRSIAERELQVVARRLGFAREELQVDEVDDSPGPGNVISICIESKQACDVFTGFGQPTRRAEAVASDAVREAKNYLAADVPVGEHLADQLMIPFALAGAGRFRTLPLSSHALTNLRVIRQFLPVAIDFEQKQRVAEVRVGGEEETGQSARHG